jgi:hypothetical protein
MSLQSTVEQLCHLEWPIDRFCCLGSSELSTSCYSSIPTDTSCRANWAGSCVDRNSDRYFAAHRLHCTLCCCVVGYEKQGASTVIHGPLDSGSCGLLVERTLNIRFTLETLCKCKLWYYWHKFVPSKYQVSLLAYTQLSSYRSVSCH